MKWRNIIMFFLFLGFLTGGFFLFATIFGVDPTQANPIQFLIFFASFFLFWFTISAMIGVKIRENATQEPGNLSLIKVSARQALEIAGFLTGLVFLRIFGFLSWWTAIVLALIFILLEVYFKSK